MEAMGDLGNDDVELARVTATATRGTAWARHSGDEAGARRRCSVDGLLPGPEACVDVREKHDRGKYGGRGEQSESEPTSCLRCEYQIPSSDGKSCGDGLGNLTIV